MDQVDVEALRKKLQADEMRQKLAAEESPAMQESSPKDGPSKLRSFAEGLGDTASFGFGDELAGVVGAAMEGFSPGSYTESRDFARKSRAESSAANPKTAIGGQLAGAIASAVATGKIIPTPSTALGRIALAMGFGGAQGAGSSNAEDFGGVVSDTAKGAAIGGATAGVLEKIPAIADRIGNYAARRASKAVGIDKGLGKTLGKEKLLKVGRQALDEGIVSHPGANATDDMLTRAEALRERGGAGMQDIYNKMDERNLSTFDPESIVDKFRAQEGGFYSSPANKDISGQFDSILDTIGMRGKNLPFAQQQALKEEMGKLSNWKSAAPSDKALMARKAYGLVNKGIDDAATAASPALGQDAQRALQIAKDQYAGGAVMAGTPNQVGSLENKLAGEMTSNRGPFGLMDAVFAGAGGTIGGPIGIAKGYALKKGIDVVTKPSNQAWTADMISKTLQGSPQVFGKFAAPLQKAAQRGTPALTATNFVLSQTQPEYRELQRQLNGQESPEGR